MPDDHLKIEPELADQYLASDEESQLELQLQRNLEEDVARDAYTECDIQHQEKEIITYLDNNLNIIETTNKKTKEDLEELEAYSTPKCATPYIEKVFQKAITSSPSTELTKEYYALVPIETNQLEKELIEQDALSNAFQSIIRGQSEDQLNKTQRNKPTSLSLTSSHKSKTVRHSNSCDILNKICLRDNVSPKREQNNLNSITSQDSKTNKTDTLNPLIDSNIVTNINSCDFNSENGLDPAYSPDSLITDEPSSSSDYLSAAYTCSPGVSSSGHLPQLNVGNNTAKMENIFTLSDSGLENTAMLESINSHKSVTLADVSLSENTLHDLVTDDASISAISVSSPLDEKRSERPAQSSTCIDSDVCGNSSNKNMGKETSGTSKEEKQRQNEEIVILESSSLSSEAGSWESVILFNKHWIVPRLAEKEVCEKFLINERQYCLDQKTTLESTEHQSSHKLPLIAKKSSVKSTSCFIDAASLRDENEELIKITTVSNESLGNVNLNTPVPSRPMPCSTNKFTLQLDASPLDCSEGNDNEDSLEQAESKDPDSAQKDLTPTIFEMTPNTEDSLCTNDFETQIDQEYMDNINASDKAPDYISGKNMPLHSSIFVSGTPNNSIMSIKLYESKIIKNISISPNTLGENKQNDEGDSPPILSGGMSIQDHLPQLCSSRENSPLLKRRSENTPIVSGAYVPQPDQSNVDSDKEKQKIPSSSAWVVDMTTVPNLKETSTVVNKNSEDSSAEKKNIFSMYIDLGDKTTLKDMPTRLSSSINSKRQVTNTDNKSASKISKVASKLNDSDCSNSTHPSNNQTMLSFEKYESLCDDPNVSLSEIISISEKKHSLPKVIEKSEREINETRVNNSKQSWLNGANDVSCMISAITEEATDLPSSDLFVRLSDLDKPVQKSDLALTKELKEMNVRMTRSIPDNNWEGHTISATSRSIEVISSFHSENALSLNRLFPHLKNEFSRSMPGSLSTRTIGDAVEQGSDASEVSSMQSSTCRSGFGNSTTDSQTTSLIENCTSRLGQDLLRMFLEEIAPDVIVEVSGKRFKAHKCILSSRCQYFAGILSGGWVESLGNVIVLPPFSYNVVYFALCHIYSGLATIPDSVSIVELATIADMLGLEGLKEAIMFTLKAKYCHHFHKPCSVCIVGVLECFPLSSVYGLDDLYHKCLKWITKHFSKVWPTKAFATLPTDLLDKCYQHHIVNLTVDNFVETVYGCGITAASLQNRWAESVARMCRRLMNAAAHFAAPRLVQLLHVIAGIPVDAPHAAKEALDDCITAAIEWAPPEETCRAYHFLSSLIKDLRNQHYSKPDLISNGSDSIKAATQSNLLYTYAGRWRSQCEGALVRATPRVVTTQAFKDLPSDLRKRLRELGCITYEGDTTRLSQSVPVKVRKSRNVYNSENSKRHSFNSSIARSVDIARVRASFVPYCPKPAIPPGSVDRLRSNNDLHDFKKANSAILPKVRTTKAQEQRAKFNKYKNDKSQERLNRMAMSRVQQFENTKPRYLEPKSSSTCKHKRNPIIEPLSESSRNSSPIQVRNLKVNALKVRQGGVEAHTISHDSQASASRPHTAEPSTDSLSESQTSNKYATYTKSKHPAKGSKESIKSSNCYNDSALSKSLNHNNKMKTKIPVYLKQTPKPKIGECNNGKEIRKCLSVGNSSSVNAMPTERKTPGSLMNATKSSSAKIVPKVVRDLAHNRKNQRRQEHVSRLQEDKPPKETPMIQRSGTFLKDEPTFGKQPTDIDIDQ